MAELHWFPFFAQAWLSSPARLSMTPEQRGAYIDLLAIAWANGEEEPSLEDNDEKLAIQSGLGKRWGKLGPLIRAQFTEGDGRLYNHKLSNVWHDAQIKHDKAVERGKTGGRTRAAKLKSKLRAGQANGIDGTNQSQLQEEVESLQTLPSSAPSGALGAETPRAPAPPDFQIMARIVDTRRARTTDGDMWWAAMQSRSGLKGHALYAYAYERVDKPFELPKERAHV